MFCFYSTAITQTTGGKYALLVGVEDYNHDYLRSPQLKYSVDDASELAKVLNKFGYQVTLLSDQTGQEDSTLRPTKVNIERELTALLQQCGRNDVVIVALAGHGVQFGNKDDAYFCPIDARPFEDKTDSMLSMKFVYQELEACFAGVRILFLDACRDDPEKGRGRDGLNADSAPRPSTWRCGIV